MEIDLTQLAAPFPPTDVEWRIQTAGKGTQGIYAKAIAYLDNRAIVERLDQVCGIGGWQNRFEEWSVGQPGVLCGIGIKIEGEWIWKWDGAEQPKEKGDGQPVAVKGGFSAAMKRAASTGWGIGRYLYGLPEKFVQIVEKNTPDARYAKLPEKSGGDKFYWIPPELPRWALPEGMQEQEGRRQQAARNTAPAPAAPASAAGPPAPRPAGAPGAKTSMTDMIAAGVMPFGRTKGVPFLKLEIREIEGARDWARERGLAPEIVQGLVKAVEDAYAAVNGPALPGLAPANAPPPRAPISSGSGFEDFPEALDAEDDDLPF